MQVGSLGGSKESESNFQCPTCSQPLSAAQVFTKPALKKARGQAEGTQQAGGAAQTGWHSSSKVEHLLELLRGMQHRGATGYLLNLSLHTSMALTAYVTHLDKGPSACVKDTGTCSYALSRDGALICSTLVQIVPHACKWCPDVPKQTFCLAAVMCVYLLIRGFGWRSRHTRMHAGLALACSRTLIHLLHLLQSTIEHSWECSNAAHDGCAASTKCKERKQCFGHAGERLFLGSPLGLPQTH